VSNAALDTVTKTLTIQCDPSSNFDEIITRANEEVRKLEPNVIVKESIVDKGVKKALVLMGIG